MSFEEAAIEYTMDNATKGCGGCIQNPQTGETRISMDMLDADLYFKIEKMKPGEISDPMEIYDPSGGKNYHIIYFKRQIDPHVANLKDDYQKDSSRSASSESNMKRWKSGSTKRRRISISISKRQNA